MTIKICNDLFINGTDLSYKSFMYSNELHVGGGSSGPSWKDIILKGVTALTLVNSKANGLNYLKLFGGCEQTGTPTPTQPLPINTNNGVIKYGQYGNNIFNKDDTANIGSWYSGSNQTITLAGANETLVMRAKPNTTYYFKHCSVKGGCRAFYTEVEDWETGSDCSTMSGNAATNANVVYSITTSANAKWIFFNYGRNNLEVSFDDQRNDFMVSTSELTSETPYEPYKFGLHVDGTTETVEVTGKNLFDINSCIAGTYINSEGATNTSTSWICSGFIPVLPNTGYVFTVDTTSGASAKHCFYSQAQTESFISSINSGSQTFTTPPNARYMRISVRNKSEQAQLEFGSTATTYEQYYNGGSATAEMLLAIDDNKDEHNVTSGDVIRKIGIKIFDGSETFTASTVYGKACLIQGASNSWGADRSEAVLCTHFLGMPTTTSKAEDYTCFFNVTGHFYFRLEDNTVATFKQFLADQYNAGTPVIVFFVKATPTTETVTPQPLTIQEGTNIVEITQASIDNLELEVSYKDKEGG